MLNGWRISRKAGRSILVMLGLVVAGSGWAFAATAASNKVIHACAAKRGGALRLAGKCSKTERAVTWNVQGVPGKNGFNGTNGTNGTDGAPGATNVAIRFATFTSDAFGQSGHVHVECNPGERAVGGGIGWTQSPGSGDAVVYSGPDDANFATTTFPAQGATPIGWAGEIKTSDGAGKTGRIYAICASP